MSEALTRILLTIFGALFSAGGFYVYVRLSITRLREDAAAAQAQIRQDVNAMGKKLNENEKAALSRHFNAAQALQLVAPEEKKPQVCELLREGK